MRERDVNAARVDQAHIREVHARHRPMRVHRASSVVEHAGAAAVARKDSGVFRCHGILLDQPVAFVDQDGAVALNRNRPTCRAAGTRVLAGIRKVKVQPETLHPFTMPQARERRSTA
jgi:hypothetical protein